MKGKAQSAMEFLITYDWALLLIAIFLAALYFFVIVPYVLNPNYCVFSNGVACEAMFLATNLTHATTIGLLLTNTQSTPISNPSILASVNNANSSIARCMPNYVLPGGSIICILKLPMSSSINTYLSGSFYLHADSCTYVNQANCTLHQVYNAKFSGHTTLMPSPKVSISLSVASNSVPADGTPVQLSAFVKLFGYPLKGAVVNFTSNASSAYISPAYTLSDTQGHAISSISSKTIQKVRVNAAFANVSANATISFLPYLSFYIY
ncbi:MAG: hypothetical protein QXD11_01050, partial [Candidatus Micrarchaeaceae archaeon]